MSLSLIRMLLRVGYALFQHKKAQDKVRAVENERERAAAAMKAMMEPYKKGEYEAALVKAEELREHGQETANYCFMRGALLLELGQLGEAERLLRKSINMETDPKLLALCCSSLGQVLMKNERYVQAMNCFDTGLQHQPKKAGFRRMKAEVLLRQGNDPQAALKLAREAVALEADPESSVETSRDINMAENLATLAWAVASAEGPRAEVDQLVAKAVPMVGKEVVESTAHVHYHSGLAYVAFEDFAKTRQHMEAAVQADPQGRWGRDAKKMLEALGQLA